MDPTMARWESKRTKSKASGRPSVRETRARPSKIVINKAEKRVDPVQPKRGREGRMGSG